MNYEKHFKIPDSYGECDIFTVLAAKAAFQSAY